MSDKPLAIDLCCGLGGWAEALLAEGYEVIGYDIEAHDYGQGGYPGTLILQDITTLHGSQFKDAALFVCSPPCQKYSYMAMPWSRAKAQRAAILADETGQLRRELTLLFDTCFRIQREAIEAAGHHIPMVVENVRGAQEWVGRARWHYGSFFLWGDVPALMPITFNGYKAPCQNWNAFKETGAVSAHWRMQGVKPPSVRLWGDGVKVEGQASIRNGHTHARHLTNKAEHDAADGIKLPGNNAPRRWEDREVTRLRDAVKDVKIGGGCHDQRTLADPAKHWSRSVQRKRAAAEIAKIPFHLAQHIARTYKP